MRTHVGTLLAASAIAMTGCTNERLASDQSTPSTLAGLNVEYATSVFIGNR